MAHTALASRWRTQVMATRDRRPLLRMILALLLVSTTPIGTGGGVHQFDLVHPLFTHLHLYEGRVLTHEQLEQAMAQPHSTRVVALGLSWATGNALPTGEAGPALSPTLPFQGPSIFVIAASRAFDADLVLPRQIEEAPPDPPPTAAFA
jgi:hypothetical protein